MRSRHARLSNRTGKNYAPKIIAQEAEAKDARVNESHLRAAMDRLLEKGVIEIFEGYKNRQSVYELRIAER
jgi:hypothetical protein